MPNTCAALVFAAALVRLRELGARAPTAIMRAERDPADRALFACHRRSPFARRIPGGLFYDRLSQPGLALED